MTLMAVLVAVSAMAQSRNRIYIEDFEIDLDSTLVVPVMLANQDESRGLQFNITLPDGLRMIDRETTDYAQRYNMSLSCNYSQNTGSYLVIMYPTPPTCFPPDTMAVMTITFKALPNFKGGLMPVWKCRGSTMDNETIFMDNDTTKVTVPSSSLIGVPTDTKPVWDQYFNMMGMPIDSPDSVPVAIHVTTAADGRCVSRKVAVSHN